MSSKRTSNNIAGALNKPPEGKSYVWLTRELLESDAWRGLGINARRFIDFLQIEHMRRGAIANGDLKAPARQLYDFGVGEHQLTAAIEELEARGLIEVHRGGMRVATTYALTWLPSHDGEVASDRWRAYTAPRPAKKSKNLPVNQQAGLPVNQQADGPNLPVNQQADAGRNLPVNQQALLRTSSSQA
jgi:hypothetical protein